MIDCGFRLSANNFLFVADTDTCKITLNRLLPIIQPIIGATLGRLMVKILITTIQVNFVPRPSGTKFTSIVVIKIFTINLPSQPFLGRHLGFHIFFHHNLSQGRTLFLQLGCFGLDFTSFCICIPQSRP